MTLTAAHPNPPAAVLVTPADLHGAAVATAQLSQDADGLFLPPAPELDKYGHTDAQRCRRVADVLDMVAARLAPLAGCLAYAEQSAKDAATLRRVSRQLEHEHAVECPQFDPCRCDDIADGTAGA